MEFTFTGKLIELKSNETQTALALFRETKIDTLKLLIIEFQNRNS